MTVRARLMRKLLLLEGGVFRTCEVISKGKLGHTFIVKMGILRHF